MSGYSTIVGGTIVSPTRLNYDITTNASSTIPDLLTDNGITDKMGLQFVVYNNGASAIGISATDISNYLSYPKASTSTIFTLQAGQSVTFITVSIGSSYEISASSAQFNITGGSAGNLVYQTAANTTEFAASGTSGYVLSNIVGTPNWSAFYPPNLALSPAGSVDYQSATSVTTTTGAGTAFSNTGGGLMSNTSGTPNWSNAAFTVGMANTTYSGGIINLKAARQYTIYTTQFGAGGVLLLNWLNLNLNTVTGNTYVIVNDRAATYPIVLNDYQNGASYSPTFLNTATKTINLYPGETVVFQQYNSTAFNIDSTTQSQGWISVATGSTTAFIRGVDANIEYGTGSVDPNSWITSKLSKTNNAIQPTRPGYYLCNLTMSTQPLPLGFSRQGWAFNLQLRKNNVQQAIFSTVNFEALGVASMAFSVSSVIYLNGSTDYVNSTMYCQAFTNIPDIYPEGTTLTVQLLN